MNKLKLFPVQLKQSKTSKNVMYYLSKKNSEKIVKEHKEKEKELSQINTWRKNTTQKNENEKVWNDFNQI